MTDPLTRAKQLIAFALDPVANPHEARNMAMRVCEIIVKYKLLDRAPPPPVEQPRPQPRAATIDDLFRDMGFDGFTSRPRAERPTTGTPEADPFRPYTRPTDYPPAPPPPQPSIPGDARPKRPRDPEQKLTLIVDAQICKGCHQLLRRGTYAIWSRGEAWHGTCLIAATEDT